MNKSKELILNIAFKTLSKSGYHGLSLSSLLSESKLSKGAFYHHFKSKEALVLEVVNYNIQEWLDKNFIDPLKVSKNPIKGIKAVFSNYLELDEKELLLGNPLSTLLASDPPESVQKACQNLYLKWINNLSERIETGVKRRYLKPNVDPIKTAHTIIIQIIGVISFSQGLENPGITSEVFTNITEKLEELNYKGFGKK